MDLLYVTNGFPYPLTSGYLRHYHLLGELGRRHRVSLLSLVGPRFEEADRAALTDRTERIVTIPGSAGGGSKVQQARRRLELVAAQGDPAARRLGDAIRELRRERGYDAAVFSGRRTYPALAALDGLPLVVDMCDATSLRLRGHLRVAPGPRRPVVALDLLLTSHLERRLIARADHLLFATWRDRQTLLRGSLARRPASIVPNGVDAAAWQRRPEALGRRTIVFTGAMDYAPNVDAAIQLAGEILPRVRGRIPDAHLLIVGRDPVPAVRALAQAEGVTVTGFVDEVLPFLEQASVFAAPLRFGAGIQNKLLEALAAGVPVVASPLAAAGLQLAPGERPPVAVAGGGAAFATAIADRLDAVDRDPSPDETGRAWVTERFDWARSGALLETILSDLAADRRSGLSQGSPSSRASDAGQGSASSRASDAGRGSAPGQEPAAPRRKVS